jgi:phage-related protein
MADVIPPILIKLSADVNDLKAGLTQAQNSLKGLDDNIKKSTGSMTNFVGKLKSVGAALGATFAVTQLSSFAKDTVMAASSMAESLSKVNVVFGEGAAEVIKFGESAAQNLGISNQAALEATGTYGNLFQAFGLGQGESQKMSTTLVQLAADMASFNNTSVDDAIVALRSGLSGETEPLKRFGVALSEVRLKEEALRMGLIKTMSGTLPVAIKSQAAYSLILKDTALSQGDYARTADGTANTMKTLQARFQDAKVALGDALMPAFRGLLKILGLLIPVLKAIGNFFKNNQDEVKAFAITVGVLTAAYGAYLLVTNAATIATKALSIAMKANPIGLVVVAIGLLVAGFVKLYKSNETFRNAVISVAKVAIRAFAAIIPMIGQVFEAIMKISTGPLRLLLLAMSKLPGVGKYAKEGLDFINKGLNGISDFADKAAKKANELADSLGKVNKEGAKTKDAIIKRPTTAGGIDPSDAKEKAASEKKRLSEVKSLQKKYESEQKQLAGLEEKKAKLIADYQKDVAKRNAKYDEDVIRAKEATAKKILEIEKDYNEQILDAQKDAAEKRREIVQQSIDRLRDVFRSASALDVGKMFADLLKGEDPTKATTTTLVDKFKQQLADIKLLAANATALSNKGFNQVFIEQVVGQGTEVGNKLAQEILNSTPETIGQLQTLFTQIQETSETGVDVLGKTMYEKLGLATEELKANYVKVGTELNEALAQYAADFAEAMAEAKSDLAETLKELQKDLQADLAEMQDAFHVALAEINKDIAETIAQINSLMAALAALGAMTGLGGGGGGGGRTDSAATRDLGSDYARFKAKERADELQFNITNNVTSNVSAQEIADATQRAIKFGQTVTVGKDR